MPNKKILMVDDSLIMRQIFKRILADQGFTIVEADKGELGVEKYKLESPDISFLDINLPDISGIEVTKRIMALNPNAQIIILSGTWTEKNYKNVLEAGAKRFLLKPPNLPEILSAIQALEIQ